VENYPGFFFGKLLKKKSIFVAPPITTVMNCYAIPTAFTILYIDDDSDDCMLLQSSLEEAGSKAQLVCANTGEEAVRYLNSISSSSLPALIVMDVNMPRWDGKQTLAYLKSQPHLAGIPVVMLSTSGNKATQEACVQLGAASYFKKPYHYEGYKNIIDNFSRFLKAS
jgi:CheY-like chemotaxis protein